MNTTISSTSPRRLGGLLLKALAAGALVFSLAGCIPIPILEITPAAPETGESVTFDGTGTIVSNIPEDTVAVSYRWTFGDGEKGSGSSITHTYEKAGTYEVMLKVIDSAGRVGETTETITVTAASITSTPTEETTTEASTTDSTTEATTTDSTTEAGRCRSDSQPFDPALAAERLAGSRPAGPVMSGDEEHRSRQ